MPFIDSKVSISISPEQEQEIVQRLGQAISIIPGKSESWLMTGFEQNYHLYFRGKNVFFLRTIQFPGLLQQTRCCMHCTADLWLESSKKPDA